MSLHRQPVMDPPHESFVLFLNKLLACVLTLHCLWTMFLSLCSWDKEFGMNREPSVTELKELWPSPGSRPWSWKKILVSESQKHRLKDTSEVISSNFYFMIWGIHSHSVHSSKTRPGLSQACIIAVTLKVWSQVQQSQYHLVPSKIENSWVPS
jgi:hypothetical protein